MVFLLQLHKNMKNWPVLPPGPLSIAYRLREIESPFGDGEGEKYGNSIENSGHIGDVVLPAFSATNSVLLALFSLPLSIAIRNLTISRN
jgi:hypothetical protein